MNKGFTLVELMAIIAILAIIAVIAFPFIQDSINNSKEKTCQQQKRTIETAAERWAADNSSKIKGNISISVNNLKSNGYLASDKKIVNPVDNKEMNGSVQITYDATYHQYDYIYNVDCKIK